MQKIVVFPLLLPFSEFPNGCLIYEGPLSDACYITLFFEAGCIQAGDAYPPNLPAAPRAQLEALNLRWVCRTLNLLEDFVQLEFSAESMAAYGERSFPYRLLIFFYMGRDLGNFIALPGRTSTKSTSAHIQ